MGLVCTREYIFGGVYLIAWILLAVGCVHYKWLCKSFQFYEPVQVDHLWTMMIHSVSIETNL